MDRKVMFYTHIVGEGRQPSQSDDMSKMSTQKPR